MINYNLYRHYFPLMALGRARAALRGAQGEPHRGGADGRPMRARLGRIRRQAGVRPESSARSSAGVTCTGLLRRRSAFTASTSASMSCARTPADARSAASPSERSSAYQRLRGGGGCCDAEHRAQLVQRALDVGRAARIVHGGACARALCSKKRPSVSATACPCGMPWRIVSA